MGANGCARSARRRGEVRDEAGHVGGGEGLVGVAAAEKVARAAGERCRVAEERHRSLPPRRDGGEGAEAGGRCGEAHAAAARHFRPHRAAAELRATSTRFCKDTAPDAFSKVVDRLLGSAQFGEKWGRHWLDVARYAESTGKDINLAFPNAWRYRDYVIAAFNKDKPYDQFLREQLAGDLLPAKDDKQRAEQLVATGFLAMGTKSVNQANATAVRARSRRRANRHRLASPARRHRRVRPLPRSQVRSDPAKGLLRARGHFSLHRHPLRHLLRRAKPQRHGTDRAAARRRCTRVAARAVATGARAKAGRTRQAAQGSERHGRRHFQAGGRCQSQSARSVAAAPAHESDRFARVGAGIIRLRRENAPARDGCARSTRAPRRKPDARARDTALREQHAGSGDRLALSGTRWPLCPATRVSRHQRVASVRARRREQAGRESSARLPLRAHSRAAAETSRRQQRAARAGRMDAGRAAIRSRRA